MKRRETLGGIFRLIVETGLLGLGNVLNYGCCCMKKCESARSCTIMHVIVGTRSVRGAHACIIVFVAICLPSEGEPEEAAI